MSTWAVPLTEGVQRYHTEEAVPSVETCVGSPVSPVAPTTVPRAVPTFPARDHAAAKLSLDGGVTAGLTTSETVADVVVPQVQGVSAKAYDGFVGNSAPEPARLAAGALLALMSGLAFRGRRRDPASNA